MTREESAALEGIRTDVRTLSDYVRGVVEGPKGLLVRLAVVERDVASLLDRGDDDPPAGSTSVGFPLPDLMGAMRLAGILGSLIGAGAAGAAATWAAMQSPAEANTTVPVEAP